MVSKHKATLICWFCSNIQCSESVGLLRLQHEPFHAIVATYRNDLWNGVAHTARGIL